MTASGPDGPGDVSRETTDRLQALAALTAKWTARINLIGPGTVDDIWQRHIVDSAQICRFAPSEARRWVDLGSGAGFPGLVVAIIAAERNPGLQVTLVESDLRKAAFLATAIRDLQVSAMVETARIEALAPQGADVLSARALAPLPRLLQYAERHLAPGGTAIFPKGARFQGEIDAALETWSFSVQKHPSTTDPDSVILTIGEIARV